MINIRGNLLQLNRPMSWFPVALLSDLLIPSSHSKSAALLGETLSKYTCCSSRRDHQAIHFELVNLVNATYVKLTCRTNYARHLERTLPSQPSVPYRYGGSVSPANPRDDAVSGSRRPRVNHRTNNIGRRVTSHYGVSACPSLPGSRVHAVGATCTWRGHAIPNLRNAFVRQQQPDLRRWYCSRCGGSVTSWVGDYISLSNVLTC
jgi:hypothetical protein